MLTFTPVVRAFRFYADGTESGSTPLENQDTNHTTPLLSADYPFQLRYSISETGGASGTVNDDYRFQVSKNGGAYAYLPSEGGTDGCTNDNGSSLTDEGATTNRATNGISDPSGTFVAGRQTVDGNTFSFQLTASNFTEFVCACQINYAYVNNGDYFEFRLALSNGTPGMTNSVTPRITVKKPWALDSTNSTASLSGTSTGYTNHQASSTSDSSVSGTSTGYPVKVLESTAASSIDGTATGSYQWGLSSTSGSSLEGTSTGAKTHGLTLGTTPVISARATTLDNSLADELRKPITIPAHSAGDLIIVSVQQAGNTAGSMSESFPSYGFQPLWTNIYHKAWFKVAQSNSETLEVTIPQDWGIAASAYVIQAGTWGASPYQYSYQGQTSSASVNPAAISSHPYAGDILHFFFDGITAVNGAAFSSYSSELNPWTDCQNTFGSTSSDSAIISQVGSYNVTSTSTIDQSNVSISQSRTHIPYALSLPGKKCDATVTATATGTLIKGLSSSKGTHPNVTGVSTQQYLSNHGTSRSVTIPTHATGDFLCVYFGIDEATSTLTLTESGWTEVAGGTNFVTVNYYYKVAASAAETFTMTTSSAPKGVAAAVVIQSGTFDSTPTYGFVYAAWNAISGTVYRVHDNVEPWTVSGTEPITEIGIVSVFNAPIPWVDTDAYNENTSSILSAYTGSSITLGTKKTEVSGSTARIASPRFYVNVAEVHSGSVFGLRGFGNGEHVTSTSATATGEVVSGGTTHSLASTAGVAQLDGTATGGSLLPLESTSSAQVDGTSIGSTIHPLDSTAATQVDGTATGSVVIIHPLASTDGIAQLDGTSTGGAVLDLASTAASSASGTSTGVLLFDLGSTASAQLDGTSTGTCVHPLAASSGTAQVDGTATGSALVIHQVSSTSAAQIDGTSTGVVKFALEGTGDASVSGTSTGVTLYSIASTAASSFSGTSTGTAVLAVDSTSSSSVSGTSTGTNVKPVASSSSASQLDGTSTGVVVKPLGASSASSVSGTSTGTRVTPVASTSASSVSGTSTGTNIHPLAATYADSVDGTATGEVVTTLIQQISATASSVLDGTCNGGFQFKIDASLASQVDVLSTGTRVQYISNYLEI